MLGAFLNKPLGGLLSTYFGRELMKSKVKYRGRFFGQSAEAKRQAIEKADKRRARRDLNRAGNHYWAVMKNPTLDHKSRCRLFGGIQSAADLD